MKLDPEFEPASPPGIIPKPVAHSRLHSAARTLLDSLVTTIFPAECRCCAGPLTTFSAVPVCTACLHNIAPSPLACCWRCGEGMEFDPELLRLQAPESTLCRECSLTPPPFTRAVAYGTYQHQLRELIRLLKFEHVPAVATLLGSRLAQAILSLESGLPPQRDLLVIAVPLFTERQRTRGYNQSILLANAALRHLRRLHPAWQLTAAHAVLQRQRSTESSFVLSRRERRRNLRGAFRLRPSAATLLHGREVLLIDDILTSGATARECARVLIAGGASRVWVATLARAQKQSVLDLYEAPVAVWDLSLSHVHATPSEV